MMTALILTDYLIKFLDRFFFDFFLKKCYATTSKHSPIRYVFLFIFGIFLCLCRLCNCSYISLPFIMLFFNICYFYFFYQKSIKNSVFYGVVYSTLCHISFLQSAGIAALLSHNNLSSLLIHSLVKSFSEFLYLFLIYLYTTLLSHYADSLERLASNSIAILALLIHVEIVSSNYLLTSFLRNDKPSSKMLFVFSISNTVFLVISILYLVKNDISRENLNTIQNLIQKKDSSKEIMNDINELQSVKHDLKHFLKSI